MIDIRQPNITAKTDPEQLAQIRSYLYQLSQQLQWAFSTVTGEAAGQNAGIIAAPAGNKAAFEEAEKQAATFARLKDLIIKSADIVEAYYEKISQKLEGIYVAQSEFGTYQQATSQLIEADSQRITQNYTNLQQITLNYGDLNDALGDAVDTLSGGINNANGRIDEAGNAIGELQQYRIETNAYIKTGMLFEDEHGIPHYGLEIGQTNDVNGTNIFNKFARFTADRLSFFDRNGTEVAYISDRRLFITDAEITGTLQLAGRFRISYKNGLAFYWIGGNN